MLIFGFPGGSDGKASAHNAGNLGSIPGSGRFPGEGNGNPLQYSCLENPMDERAWCKLLPMGLQRVGHDWVTSFSLKLVRLTRGQVSIALHCPEDFSSVQLLRRVQFFVATWTVAHEAPPSMEFSRQEYWSGLPCPSPGDLPGPGIEPGSPTLWADTLPSEPPGKSRKLCDG